MATKTKSKSTDSKTPAKVVVEKVDVEEEEFTEAKGLQLGWFKTVLGLILLFGIIFALRSYSNDKSLPYITESLEKTNIKTVELTLLPGEEAKLVKAYRIFADGSEEMLEYSVDIQSRDPKGVVNFSAQGENGAEGNHHKRGDWFSLEKNYMFAGANHENRDTYFLKFWNTGTVPFNITVYLKGYEKYKVFPQIGKKLPLAWD